jgi:hypothetical protein
MRSLVLCHEGAPMAVDQFAGPLRRIILDHPDDDCDLWQVFEVAPAESLAPSREITKQFALDWASEIIAERGFGDGIEPHDYLAPFPAFVREAARDKLIAKWQAQIIDLPNPLRKAS